MATPGQAVFVRDMLFNLASVVDWRVVTSVKQRQLDIDNVREISKQVICDSLGVFSDIINVYLTLLCSGYNSLVNNSREFK